jgi:hypothetical protein
MAVTSKDEMYATRMKKKVYKSLLLPILSCAVASGDLPNVPPLEMVPQITHVLPAKANQVKTIICPFINRDLKAII